MQTKTSTNRLVEDSTKPAETAHEQR